jgi:hypothetical protein
MYTIKKHMEGMPEFRDQNITKMGKNEYDKLNQSEWAQLLKDKRPNS